MHVRKIKKEAKERFVLDRYHAMLVYGAVYTLAYLGSYLWNMGGIIKLCGLIPWIYGAILVLVFLLALAPFNYGMTGYYTKIYKFEKPEVSNHVFEGFNKFNLERMIVLRLISLGLGICFTALLIVPGIIFGVRTSMATYLLRANPKLKPHEALKASNEIMKGHCWKYFGMMMSFIGWYLMCIGTCGLGLIWLLPYVNASKTVFYKRELQGDKTVYRNPALGAKMSVSDDDDDEEDDDEEDDERARLMREIESVNAQMTTAPDKKQKKTAKPQPYVQNEPIQTAEESDYEFTTTPYEPAAAAEPEPIMFTAEQPDRFETVSMQFSAESVEEFEPTESTATEVVVENPRQVVEPTRRASAETKVATPSARRTSAETSAARPTADATAVRRTESAPIAGTRITQSADGTRTVTRPTQTQSTRPGTTVGESVSERLERLKAERAAKAAGTKAQGEDGKG